MTDFYMTLFSNSSMGYHTNNKISSFTVQLPRSMCLSGDWKVALTEVQYPYSFLNVQKNQNEIQIQSLKVTKDLLSFVLSDTEKNATSAVIEAEFKVATTVCTIAPGFYSDTKKLISAVNKAIVRATSLEPATFEFFILDTDVDTLTATPPRPVLDNTIITSLGLSDRLALQLGYIPGQPLTDANSAANHTVNLISGIPDKMLIYCDIIEPQICGDVWSKILRSVSTPSKSERSNFGRPCTNEFTQLQYVTVQMKHFDSITIDIRDINGELMPFQFGTLSVKLHFKQF